MTLGIINLCLLIACIATQLLQNRRMGKRVTTLCKYVDKQAENWETAGHALEGRVAALESGASPDYERVKTAMNNVNSLYDGLNNIFSYDPAAEYRKSHEKGSE